MLRGSSDRGIIDDADGLKGRQFKIEFQGFRFPELKEKQHGKRNRRTKTSSAD